ncbi:carbonic anhydrase 1-like [Diachasmimorpha longicaudata]|uniref:carbonic anhydrase 1-like n=1 Tax=Diachasmimorpha longicaudata TaxID=58733 RepID=UPI0030B89CC7
MEIIETEQVTGNQSRSPIDLNMSKMTVVNLKSLDWHNYEIVPKKLKITNTGRNVVVCGNWQKTPHLSSGPLRSDYTFSQIHFHWGPTEMMGSEHLVDGASQPMELHAVHFKSDYLSQEAAMRETDGITMLVYFFKLQSVPNLALNGIVNSLSSIQPPDSSIRIPVEPISNILRPFEDDYFLYKGTVPVGKYETPVMWLFSREPIAISLEQVAQFRNLNDRNFNRILNNLRPLACVNPPVFYANPKGSNYASLLPVSPDSIP